MMYEFLKEHRIPFKKCGKLIVAVKEEEIENLNALYEKAQVNHLKMIHKTKLYNFHCFICLFI